MDEQDILIRGNEAKMIISTKVWNELFDAMYDTYHREWLNSNEPSKRELIFFKVNALKEIEKSLKVSLDSADMIKYIKEQTGE